MKKLLISLFVLVLSLSVVMAVDCPAGTSPVFVETVNVNANQNTAVSTSALVNGVDYLLEASGTAFAGGHYTEDIEFDAKYSITHSDVLDDWTDDVTEYESYGPTLLDLFVNGGSVDWGAYNLAHDYSLVMTGTGAPVDLLIYDIYYPNNVGSLTVDVSECADVKVHGGGHMLEVENDGDKRKDWLDVSFGGFIGEGTQGLFGNWQINFHNVNKEGFDKGRFHTTEITSLNLYDGNSNTCTEAMNFGANGEFNGMPGYRIIFRAGDSSQPSSTNTDTVRVQLYYPGGGVAYDSSWGIEFTDESSCVGGSRTGLDTGNIIIQA
ncbi:hypothetical protein ACFLZJ_01090 [Nanoarchaeota archaeon]